MLRHRLIAALFALLLPGLAGAAGRLEVHFVDVGQGDAILVKTPSGKSILLDAGNIEAGEVVDQYLTREGVGALDLVIVSHPHLDHMGGMLEVLQHHKPAVYVDPGYAHPLENYDQLLDWLDAGQIPVKTARAGRTVTLEPGITLEILAPTEPLLANTRSDANSNSVVARLVYGKVSFLFTGDSEAETEKRILDGDGALESTVLKVAHHGGKYSTSDTFLRRVQPKFAVISCGKINGYGHPSAPTLDRLAAREITTYRTDRDGDVIARTDGATLAWETTGERSAKLDEPGGKRSLDRNDLRSGADPNKQEAKAAARAVKPAEEAPAAAIDLNAASAEELAKLPGIGDVLAKAIVADRAARGPYPDVDALMRVKGVGRAMVERFRPRVVANVPETQAFSAVVPPPPPAPPAALRPAGPGAAPRPEARPGLAFRATSHTPPPESAPAFEGFGSRLLSMARHARVNLNLAPANAIAAAAQIPLDQATQVVKWRTEHGALHTLAELSQVPHVGPREQAALAKCCTVRIDLNRATEKDLTALGLDGAEARAVVKRREVSGRYVSIDDLEEVDGLSPERRERVLPLLTVDRAGS